MRAVPRRRARLVLRDLAAASAFAAMAISGELPLWVLALFAGGLVLALLDRRVLSRAALASGLALAAGALGLYAQVALGALDLVVAACSFAALITLHRLLSPPHPRTDQQVMLTSLLMISGGAALSGELLFAVALAAFAALAAASLSMGVIEAALPEGADLSLRPLWPRLGAGVVVALLGSALFFTVIPRLNWNLAAQRSSRGLGATTGLSSGVHLGATGGTIKTNPRVVARVKLEPSPAAATLGAYWVARTYARWDGVSWSGEGKARPPRPKVELRAGSHELVRQQIELLPAYGGAVAMAQEEPVAIGNATAHQGNVHLRTAVVEVPGLEVRFHEAASGYTYYAYSAAPGADLLEVSLSKEERAALLALPELDPRIPKLAQQVLAGERDPLLAAAKLERHLKSNFGYTLELPESQGDPLSHFLFERKAGHCEFFATALTVLLRTQGFPARIATGFFGGERAGGEYLIRAGDAHAWTQVWVEGRGFVGFDATPEEGRGAQPSAFLEWLIRKYEALDVLWRGGILEFNLRNQAELAFKVAKVTRGARLGLPPQRAWLAAGVVALAVYAVWRLRLLRRGPGARRDRATALRERAERILADLGVRAEPGEGLEELCARVAREGGPLAQPLSRLTRRYLQARFGAVPLNRREARAHEVELRSAARAFRDQRAA